MNPQLEALEAAKIAAMVGSQLKQVDKLKIDGHTNPANRINLNQFIASVHNPNIQPQQNVSNVPHGFAPPPSEELVQRMVPDIRPSVPVTPLIPQPQPEQQLSTSTSFKSISEESKQSIENSLEKISKTLEDMLQLLKAKNNEQ